MSDEAKKAPITEEDLAKVMGGTGGISSVDLSGMDLETALMMVQQQRSALLDGQLQSQVEVVQQRNETISHMNSTLGELRALAPEDNQPLSNSTLVHHLGEETTLGELAATLGLPQDRINDGSIDKQDMEMMTDRLKGQIDAATNSQQMDMLRLQSLSNKRNEAFELMTDFVKKMQDSRSSIIGNMR